MNFLLLVKEKINKIRTAVRGNGQSVVPKIFILFYMSKVSRRDVINELNAFSNYELPTIENNVNTRWKVMYGNYGGLKISQFPDAKKAGEITFSSHSNENPKLLFPRLKASWGDDCPRTSSSYIITVDDVIVKIGALKDGVKGSSFSQYLSGISGSPSRRSCGVYTFLSAMLKEGKKIVIYHVTMDAKTNIDIPTIKGVRNSDIHYASRDIEKANVEVYKEMSGGVAPLLNFKERNATYPREFDVLYDLINRRVNKTKKYTE